MNDLGSSCDRDAMLRWHIDRYDRLRASTANRAAVVLSAAAILSAGNALILSRLLPAPGAPVDVANLVLVVLAISGAFLIIGSLFQASNVLLARIRFRKAFDAGGTLPRSIVFNASDTVDCIKDFGEFQQVVRTQPVVDVLVAAEVELWLGIQQYRKRYLQLRRSTRTLQYAGLAFLAVLVGFVIVNAMPGLA